MSKKILVLGATGKTGKRIAKKLQEMHIPVRAGSRNGHPPFDWGQPEGWDAVLQDIHTVYISFQPDFAVPAALEKIKLFVDKATRRGVQKLVLLSGRGEPEAQAGEKVVIESGLDWTVLRASWFMQNFSEYFFLDPILEGHFVVPQAKATEPFVDIDDLAEVAVAALTNDQHNQKIYELTGPELLSFKSAIRILSKAVDRPISYEEVSLERYEKMLREYHVPEDIISLVKYLFAEVLDGRNESVTNDIEKVTGHKPTTFRAYVVKTQQTGVWDLQAHDG